MLKAKIGYYRDTGNDRIAYVVGSLPEHYERDFATGTYNIVVYECINGKEGYRLMTRTEKYINCQWDYIGTELKHEITIDGKTIELSHESFEALREQLL